MALTTATLVRNRLGLDDDSASKPAIVVSANTSVTITVSGTGISLSPTLNGPYTFANTNADTIGDIATLLHANSDISATVVGDGVSALASTLLDVGSYVITSGVDPTNETLTYTPETDNTDSSIISRLISEVDNAIGRYCGRYDLDTGSTFESTTRTETYDGNGQRALLLRHAPVTSVTSVSLVDDSGTATTLSSSAYRLDARLGRLYWVGSAGAAFPYDDGDGPALGLNYRDGWPRGFQNIRVVYVAGYATVPEDLQGVATDLVVEAYLNRRENRRLASDGVGSRSVAYRSVDELVRQRAALLAPYRRWSVI